MDPMSSLFGDLVSHKRRETSATAMRNGLLLPILSSLLDTTSALTHAALARGYSPALMLRASRSAVVGMALPADVEAATSWETGTYDQQEVEANWDAVVKAYGSQELAAEAVIRLRGSIICPLYASPALIEASLDALKSVIGDEEATEILAKNPAVLTCGDGLRTADPGEIRRLATLRQVLDGIPPSVLLGSIVAASVAILAKIVLIKMGVEDPMFYQ
jgi:hypothetical protein